jgi:hypothetical protein
MLAIVHDAESEALVVSVSHFESLAFFFASGACICWAWWLEVVWLYLPGQISPANAPTMVRFRTLRPRPKYSRAGR